MSFTGPNFAEKSPLAGAEGEDVIVNRAYQRVATVRGAEGYSADLHEFRLTRGGTAASAQAGLGWLWHS